MLKIIFKIQINQIKYKNPKKTKTITLNLEREKDYDEGIYDVKAEIGTVSQSGEEKNTLELVYESMKLIFQRNI